MNFKIVPLFLALSVIPACNESITVESSSNIERTGEILDITASLNRNIFHWKSSGESLVLFERAKNQDALSFTYRKEYVAETEYLPGKEESMTFHFKVDEVSGGDRFQYRCLSPASSLKKGSVSGASFIAVLPGAQKPGTDAPDSAANIVANVAREESEQPSELHFETPSCIAAAAYLKLNLTRIPLPEGGKILGINIKSNDGAVLAGETRFSFALSSFIPEEDGTSQIELTLDSPVTSKTVDTYACTFPFSVQPGGSIEISVKTDNAYLVKESVYASGKTFEAGTLTVLDVDMSDALPYRIIDGVKIEFDNNLAGIITDSESGKPIQGVPVTDGYNYTQTDENGVYQFKGNASARAVYMSIPSEYEIPLDADGQPHYWKPIAVGSNEFQRNDFILKRRATAIEDFTFIGISDVHFYANNTEDKSYFDLFESKVLSYMNKYLNEESSAGRINNVILLNTGDLQSNVPNTLNTCKAEFGKIKIDGKTVPMFPTIGNHDHSGAFASDFACTQPWFDVFGPTDYSFNIGKVHFLCIDNINYSGENPPGYGYMMPYTPGLTDDQWKWVQQDIATVKDKEDRMLVLCVHCPIFSDTSPHYDDLRLLLPKFNESHILSGHIHFNNHRQFTNKWNGLSGHLSEEHNMPPLGGNWRCAISSEGAPNSFHVFNVKGASVSRHFLKSVNHDESFQFRVYNGSETYASPMLSGYPDECDKDGYYYFDWKTTWGLSGEGVDPTGKFIVKVFDAGSRGLNYRVYLNVNGIRTEMARVSKPQRDQAAFAYNANVIFGSWKSLTGLAKGFQNFWYISAPGGDPASAKGWKVELEVDNNDGTVSKYESDHLHTGYEGFSLNEY